jgi:hypothetical protein
MEYAADLFSSYWWLLFPLAFFIAHGWGSFMRYKRTKAKIELLKAYAASGKEPPAELMATLDRETDNGKEWLDSQSNHGRHGEGGSGVFLVVLFSGLSAVFAFVGYQGWLGDDKSMYFVAMILGVLALAFLFSSVFGRRRNRD